jgi:hypothetical protein
LTITLDVDEDSEANAIADEEQVYEAMGFKAADERAKEAAREVSVFGPVGVLSQRVSAACP